MCAKTDRKSRVECEIAETWSIYCKSDPTVDGRLKPSAAKFLVPLGRVQSILRVCKKKKKMIKTLFCNLPIGFFFYNKRTPKKNSTTSIESVELIIVKRFEFSFFFFFSLWRIILGILRTSSLTKKFWLKSCQDKITCSFEKPCRYV